MDEPSSIASAAAVHDFLLRYLADREDGNEVTLAEYLALFPGHEEEITRKHDELRAKSGPRTEDRGSTETGHGAKADPRISLEPAGKRDPADFTSELVRRLAGRGDGYGRYEIEGEVARGGQGVVLHVWDEDLRRNLAMKVIREESRAQAGRASHADSQALGRFLEEAQVTGQLDHPGVVPIHELGLDAGGRAYFTMKLVKGRDLKTVFKLVREEKEGWTQTRALNVLLKVCEAMAYAHSKGVIHRDLKPSNVMVGKYGEVHVMDWGLARVSDREDRKDVRIRPETMTAKVRSSRREASTDLDSPLLTMDGDVVGTPAYMSPEQASGNLDAMGPHSDAYAAGAILYQLLAGQMPYVPSGSRLNNYAIWYEVQKGPPTPLRELAPEAPAELVAICEKAMSRERELRYADMFELAEDLRAYLEHRVVGAYRTGAVAELKKWVERNKVLAATAAAAALALVLGTVLYVSGIARAQAETERALLRTRAIGLASASDEVIDSDTMLALLLAREAVRVEQTPDTLSRLHQAVGAVREQRVFRPAGPTALFVDALFSPAGDKLLGISYGVAFLWDLEGNETRLEGHSDWLTSATFSPSGRYILTSSQDKTVKLWDLEGQTLASFGHDDSVWTAAFSPDGRYVLTASKDGAARVWDRGHDEKPLAVLGGHAGPVRCASFSPHGGYILTASDDATGRLWRFLEEDGTVEHVVDLVGHDGPITTADFSPAGDRIVTASGRGLWPTSGMPDDTARVWDLSGNELAVLEGHTDSVECAAFSPAGDRILTASQDRTGRLWDLQGKTLSIYRFPTSSSAWSGSFSPDGRLVAFSSGSGTPWLFDLSGNAIGPLSGHEDEVLTARFSPDSRRIATACLDGSVRLWNVLDETIPALYGHGGRVLYAVYSRDGTRIATASSDRTARVWDTQGNELVVLKGHGHGVFSIEFDRGGDRLVTASRDQTARIWGLDGTELQVFEHDPDVKEVRHASFSPDGTRIATGCRDGTVFVWDVDGTEISRFDTGYWVNSVVFTPDGEQLLIVQHYGTVRLLELGDGSTRSLGYAAGTRATFSPGGDQVLVACKDGRAVLLSLTGELVREFGGHEAAVMRASFSPSGEQVATASLDGTARIWDADGTLEATLRGHTGPVLSAEFSPSGDRVLTASGDGTARTWLVDTEELIRFADSRIIRGFMPDELLRHEDLLDVPASEARELVDVLSDELVLKRRVVARLQKEGGLDDELRRISLRFAEALVDPSVSDIVARAWPVLKDPGQSAEAYARALHDIEAATELDADDPVVCSNRGVALYRTGRFERALEALVLADRFNRALPEPAFSLAYDLLFLAMAHERLGDPTRAADALERARGLVLAETDPPVVEELSGLLREAEQLIEGRER